MSIRVRGKRSNQSGMDARINPMQIHPRDVLQVAGSSGSTENGLSLFLNGNISGDNIPHLRSVFEEEENENCYSDIRDIVKGHYDEVIAKLRRKESAVKALRLRNEQLKTRLKAEDEETIKLRKEISLGAEVVAKAQQLNAKFSERNEERQRDNRELQKTNAKLLRYNQKINHLNKYETENRNDLEEGIKLVGANKRTMSMSALTRVQKIADCVESYLQCGICYDLMKDVAVVDCGHLFCLKCIVRWLKSRDSAPCPLCVKTISYVRKCQVVSSLLEYISDELPALKKHRKELMEDMSNTSQISQEDLQSAGPSHQPDVVQPAGSGQSNDSSDDSTDDSDGDSVLIIDRHIPEEIELSAQDQKIMRDAVRLSVMDEVSRVDKLQEQLRKNHPANALLKYGVHLDSA